jgi:hypothetical protein
MRTSMSTSLFVITVVAVLCLSGCGKGTNTTTTSGGGSNPISVSVAASSTTVNGGATVTMIAAVSNDSSNAGVSWTTPAIGSLSSLTTLTTTYTAPAATNTSQSVTLTATSVADKTKSASLTLTINPLPPAPVAGSVIYSNSCGPVVGPATTLTINTTPAQTTTTDSNGNFSFAAVPLGTYTITPSLSGTNALFTPATQSVVVSSGGAVASFKAVVGYAVSGTVSYTGTAAGPVDVALQYQCPGGGFGTILGTSIPAPGAFTINGASPGSYTVQAWRDAAHSNWPNASDPTGSSAVFAVSDANATGVSITLADPAPFAFPSVRPFVGAIPIDQGVVLSASIPFVDFSQVPVFWEGISGELEVATSYTVQWSTDQNFINDVQSKSFPATGGSGYTWVLNGLTNGQLLYFRDQGVVGGITSSWSPTWGPTTVGKPSGPVTVSGIATFANAATGPLYISFESQTTNNTNKTYYTEIASPVSPQHYTIQLPADGNYSTYAYIDQNNDDILNDNGDMISSGAYNLAVAGSSADMDFELQGGGSSFFSGELENNQTVSYLGSTRQDYSLIAYAWSGSKQLTAMELVSGPNVIVPQDLYRCEWEPAISFCGGFTLDGNPPNIGDAYGIKLTYSDGSTETKTYTLASVPSSFGANATPSGIGTNLTPNISWIDPANASDYTYTFSFSGSSNDVFESWTIPAAGYGLSFPSSIDSLTWGVDPTGGGNLPSQASLISGGSYDWGVSATDSYGNISNLSAGYYLGEARVYLPTANPATLGAATVGQSYSGTIVALNGSSSDVFTVTGLCDGLTSSSGGGTLSIGGTPLAAGTITFQVYVIDSTNAWWGPVTYTINVGS